MKRLLSTCLALIGFSVLMAQSTEVPSSVKMAFKDKFKSTIVEWSVSQQSYIAKWDNNNKHMRAYYTKDAQPVLVRSETDVDMTELSTGTQGVIKERFSNSPGYTFVRCFKTEGFGDAIEGAEYRVQDSGSISIFFDANGNMVKREMN